MAKKDNPDKSTEKADLETIIKRRKRTVAEYLGEKEITTEKQLKGFLKRLRSEFFLSPNFLKACDECFIKPVTRVAATTIEQDAPITNTTKKKKVFTKGKTKKTTS